MPDLSSYLHVFCCVHASSKTDLDNFVLFRFFRAGAGYHKPIPLVFPSSIFARLYCIAALAFMGLPEVVSDAVLEDVSRVI